MTHTMSDIGPAKFNATFFREERSEQILLYHLRRMGISRLLDIGANFGQFGEKMRELGYDGLIYSVEPQAAAHRKLVAAASADPRWIPLLPQGAGAKPDFLELNLSENSWSSSVLEVHQNHLSAEPRTRTVATERIYVNKSSELLSATFMQQVEAVKIDVQGYEAHVLEGYKSYIANTRLLMLEMSLVECYKGAPDMFALDKQLVQKFGFSRVSFEPVYYDDVHGVVQQFDGIYYRPDSTSHQSGSPVGVTIGAVLTWIGGPIVRLRSDGVDLGSAWQGDCARSWASLSGTVISVSDKPPPVAGVAWKQSTPKSRVIDLILSLREQTSDHIVLTNPDICLADPLRAALPSLAADVVYCGRRHEVHADAAQPGSLTSTGMYADGYDFFVLPDAFVRALGASGLPEIEIAAGEPWWDCVVPLVAVALGFPVKALDAKHFMGLHYGHTEQVDPTAATARGRELGLLLDRLNEIAHPSARGLFTYLVDEAPDLDQRLQRVREMVFHTLW
jgi:FkbM family methyltransferase